MEIKKITKLFIIAVLAAGLMSGCDSNKKPYEEAQALFDGGQFEEAAAAFEALGDYEDSAERANPKYNTL